MTTNDSPLDDRGNWGGLLSRLRRPSTDGHGAWKRSEMRRLTVDAGGVGLDVVGPFVGRLQAVASAGPVDVDALQVLTERSRIAGLRGRREVGGDLVLGSPSASAQSVGGSAWILRAADGWFCVNLARTEDAGALPALVQGEVDYRDWGSVLEAFRKCAVDGLDERSALLGLPASRVPAAPLGEAPLGEEPLGEERSDQQVVARHGRKLLHPFVVTDTGSAQPPDRPLVVDLTSLWAGPLCGALLAEAGCRVIKVEGVGRPDGARDGPEEFFDRLNAGKEMVAFDFTDPSDIEALRQLLMSADVVLEGSRPRVMDRLGINPYDLVRSQRNCWISVTAYGRTGPWSNRVGFGDDVAASAGVVSRLGETPRFVGDAIADPVGGLFAAAAAWHCLTNRRAAVVDVALREALAFSWGDTTVRSPV